MDLFRSTIFHTPDDPFQFPVGDGHALICHEDGGLLVHKGRVVACGGYADISDANPGAVTIDWRGGIVLPGLVDAHVHFPQVRVIGAMGRTLLDWLEAVALPEEARMASRIYRDTASFLRGWRLSGTRTALVFGVFAEATAVREAALQSDPASRRVSTLRRLLRPRPAHHS
jgi:guanine deaminase